MFSKLPTAGFPASILVEAGLHVQRLQTVRLDIFPRHGLTADKYLIYRPPLWIVCDRLLGSGAIALPRLSLEYDGDLHARAGEWVGA